MRPIILRRPALSVMITLVGLQMLGEMLDPLPEERDLNLGRTRVLLMQPIGGDCGGLVRQQRNLSCCRKHRGEALQCSVKGSKQP